MTDLPSLIYGFLPHVLPDFRELHHRCLHLKVAHDLYSLVLHQLACFSLNIVYFFLNFKTENYLILFLELPTLAVKNLRPTLQVLRTSLPKSMMFYFFTMARMILN